MSNGIYEKLSKIRTGIKKESISCFSELLAVIDRKTKYHKVLPLYCFYGNEATLTLVNMDDIKDKLVFQMPVELIGVTNVKEYLYKMAFDVEDYIQVMTPKQYLELTERMKERNVAEKEVLERYKLKSLAEMPQDIYKRCMSALEKSKGE